MEVKINREIREFTEAMFFGLSMRQFFFSAIAVGCTVAAYFVLRPVLGMEVTSWVCILCALPSALLGFVRYNGMNAEQIAREWLISEVLMPKRLLFGNTNLYCRLIENREVKGCD